MELKCVKLNPEAQDLFRSTSGSAGYDVSICDNRELDMIRKWARENPKELINYPRITTIGGAVGGQYYPTYQFSIEPGKSATIHTGLAVEIPEGYVGLLVARSGISNHYGITPKDCIGIIDSDYRGELMVHLVNDSDQEYFLSKNERVCQLVITPYIAPDIVYVDKISETERGTGGFGSSGSN